MDLNKINQSGVWNEYVPTDHDVQASHIADMQACGAYSLVHKAEIRWKFLTGQFWEFSERGQAKLSGTTMQGNSLQNEIKAVTNVGLILARDWPELLYSSNYPNVTWQQYYQQIAIAIQKKAYKFDVTPLTELWGAAAISAALKKDTTWVIIKTSSGEQHIVVRLNQYLGQYGLGQYYDSYEIVVKDFQPNEPIVSEWALTLTPKLMTNSKLVNNKGEWGFFIPAGGSTPQLGETALIDKANNLGYPLPVLNNGANVDWPNVVADITIS